MTSRRARLDSTTVARFIDIHPDNPQPRLLEQVATARRDGALIAYPTDSGYALGCALGNRDGRDRILRIRGLDDKHHFTLMCRDFAQLGQFVHAALSTCTNWPSWAKSRHMSVKWCLSSSPRIRRIRSRPSRLPSAQPSA